MKVSVLCLMPILVILSGCSDAGNPVNQPGNPSVRRVPLTAVRSGIFTVELDAATDAGYEWNYTISDTAVVVMDHSPTYRQKIPGPGVGGMMVETFYFRTLKSGYCAISMQEVQGWMKNADPLDAVCYDVVVR